MSRSDYDGEVFYKCAMELFSEAGHVFTSVPEFINHSPEQFVYFDNKSDVSLSKDQRALFRTFNNVSLLFSVNGCSFFSINLMTAKSERSQAAHDIHTMIHPFVGNDGTICLFRFDDEVMLSFIGFGCRCILSDWYPVEGSNNQLLERLSIANMSIERNVDYFTDMVYTLARNYYLYGRASTYGILPIDFITNAEMVGASKEELDRFIAYALAESQREYGDDYVEYDESLSIKEENISAELDLMLLEMDDENDNPFGEEIESDDDYLDDDEFFDENAEAVEQDAYEFDEVDPEIFRDPTLMVKWLNKTDE